MIELRNISKAYRVNNNLIPVFEDLNLVIPTNSIFGIIGQSGAGKSTLLRLINQLEVQDQGSILINGSLVNKKTVQAHRLKIGMIFQHFNLLWSLTVYQNIEFALKIAGVTKTERHQRVCALLDEVGLQPFKDHYPSQLSGGQKQRVGIARALANNPSILLCDEPTSALDPATTHAILSLLQSIAKKQKLTIVIISHQMEVIEAICSDVAIIEDGRIIEQGTLHAVFNRSQNKQTHHFVENNDGSNQLRTLLLSLPQNYRSGTLLHLIFDDHTTSQPWLIQISMAHQCPFSILQAHIQTTLNGAIGHLWVHTTQTMDSLTSVIDSFTSHHIEVKEVVLNEFI